MAIFSKIKGKIFGSKTSKYDQGLKKSRALFGSRIKLLANRHHKIDEDYFEELQEILISADVGYQMADTIINEIKQEVKAAKINDIKVINELILDKMFAIYTDGEIVTTRLNFAINNNITCFLVAGVNGNGKTTSIAKLAWKLKNENKKVLLIAADTFRSGAVTQLALWAEKIGVLIYLPASEKQDPASVVYQGLDLAIKEKVDIVLIDTAGRLENKTNLMQELQKINKVIKQKLFYEANEIFLVIDATTGQNGVIQAKEFTKIMPITAIILTKMDGSAKGGIILAIKEYLNLPVKLVGFGETKDDLVEFDLEQYLYSLTKDLFEGESEN